MPVSAHALKMIPAPLGVLPQRISRFHLALVLLIASLVAVPTATWGQVTTGSILGTVYDASGAVLSNAKITATNLATGLTRQAQSDNSGYYALPSLPPGNYKVVATEASFKSVETEIQVALGKATNFEFHLSLGSVDQSIEVDASSSALALETSSHEVSSVVPSQKIENLPANGRTVFQTLQSATNVSPFQNAAGPISNFRTTSNNVTIGGSASGTTSYLQDGVTNIAVLTKTANFQPPIEAVDEVSVIQNGAAARYDEPSVVNVVTRGGGNHFHGRLYNYLQNDDLDAIGYIKVTKPPLRYNQFGGNVGGPILRNKLFFFFDYSGLRESQGTTIFAVVPTASERQGNFQDDSFAIYDPATYNQTTGAIQPFANNIIPDDRISSFAKQYLAYFPNPTGSSIKGDNYQKTVNNTTRYNSYLGRVDYTIGRSDALYGAFESTNPNILNPSFSASSIFNYINVQTAKNAYAQETHSFSANTINVARFGYNDSNIYYSTTGTGSQNFVQAFGIQNLNPDPSQYAPPAVSFSTHSGLGNGTSPQGALQRLYEFADDLTLTRGSHTISIGGELDKLDFNGNWTIDNSGAFSFNGQYTSNHQTHVTGGSDLADFLLGFPSSAAGGTGFTVANFREWNVQPYIQDDWRVTHDLTINFGVRYDYYGAPADANGHSNVYDVATNTNHAGTFHQAYLDFAPRVGLAYALGSKAAAHAGYGIYYSPFQYNQLQFLMINQPNFFLQSNTYSLTTLVPVTDTFVANPTLSAQAPFSIQLNMATPYVQQWNLTFERSLGSNWVATLAYLGNKSDHLQIRQNPNQASLPVDPRNPTPIQSRRPYPWVGDMLQIASIGYGNYNSLEGSIERHFANGLSLTSNFVWSKSLDALNNGASTPQYGPDVQAEYGRSDFNAGKVFKVSGIYALPIGRSKALLPNTNRFIDTIVGGWQASGILAVQSGLPFSASATDLSQTGGNHAQRANQACDGNRPHGQSIQHWFDTACYTQTGVGQFGNEQRDSITGPRTTNLDLSFFKSVALTEKSSLQLRSDFFSALNHPLLGLPSASVTSSTYGQITSITGARVIQLSLKLIF